MGMKLLLIECSVALWIVKSSFNYCCLSGSFIIPRGDVANKAALGGSIGSVIAFECVTVGWPPY